MTETLHGRTVYFAHPIDFARLTPSQADKQYRLTKDLLEAGAVLYDPASAFTVGDGVVPHRVVAKINRTAIETADCMVACYPETPGVGVPMEIQMAEQLGMPALVLTDVADRSWSLAGLEFALSSPFIGAEQLSWLAEEAAEYAAMRSGTPAREPEPLWFQCESSEFLPVRKHHDDAGFDLFVSADTVIPPGEAVDVPCGVAMQLPAATWALILGRSSTMRKHHLLVHTAVIDTGYRGPLFALVENRGDAEFKATEGMRLCQAIPLPNLAARMAAYETIALQPSERGCKGFGSSGE